MIQTENTLKLERACTVLENDANIIVYQHVNKCTVDQSPKNPNQFLQTEKPPFQSLQVVCWILK